eukprot:TRINITY_DN15373_c0_g1_i1.p1 TRINITY_DN15373_c0_g1~~TRINITY_DN15373_c0_g1_i1.p1  ORF type:complete len:361 (+),score=73.89 TRINITY_DN15373_c0_g1_i1:50-1132(+)
MDTQPIEAPTEAPTEAWEAVNEKRLMKACVSGDLAEVQQLLSLKGEERVAVHWADSANFHCTALHVAAQHGHLEIVRALLEDGAPWNILDSNDKTAAEYAQEAGHKEIYDELLNTGIRSELILGCIEKMQRTDEQHHACNKDYLKQELKYTDDGAQLLDAVGNGVMMGWEDPLMKLHAEQICVPNPESECQGVGDILNVGFGLGLIDTYIQGHKPRSHTIIEAHPDVYKHMIELGWDKKPGVKIVFGRWQDVIHDLGFFDGIFFDTYGEFYEHLKEFHEYLGDHLKPGGTYSYFSGLAATNPFFYTVYLEIARLELSEMLGIETKFIPIHINPDEETWKGVTRKYWTLETYLLPVCTWKK